MSFSRYVSPNAAARLMRSTRFSEDPFAPRNEAILQLLYGTGLTLSEVATLTVDQVFSHSNVVESFSIEKQPNDSTSTGAKPVYLISQPLRDAMERYRIWRGVYTENQKRLVEDTVTNQLTVIEPSNLLFMNDDGEPFKSSTTTKSKKGRAYTTFLSLSVLVRALHALAGLSGHGAESARRSWSVWMVMGADGGAPMHLDWLRMLRGDKRLTTTLSAIKKDLPAGFDPQSMVPLTCFMRTRSLFN